MFYFMFQFYLHNHLSFILYYHREDVEESQEHTYWVVRFEVIPQSIKLEGKRPLRRGARGNNLLYGQKADASDVSGCQLLLHRTQK